MERGLVSFHAGLEGFVKQPGRRFGISDGKCYNSFYQIGNMSRTRETLSLARLLLALSLAGGGGVSFGQELQDMFADREAVSADAGTVQGNNSSATVEPFEPLHAGKTGGHSMWISWIPQADGVATIDTTGSSFDTLLAVYVLGPGTNQPPLQLLFPKVSNDDNETNLTSLVQFAVTAGTEYEIAVDGYFGAVGDIQLNWDLQRSTSSLPDDIHLPRDRSLRAGDTLTLNVDFESESPVALQWLFNGQPVTGAQSATLVIPNFQEVNAGRYQLQFTANTLSFITQPIEAQINSEGATNTLARSKPQDAPASELEGEDDQGGPILAVGSVVPAKVRRKTGVVLGYSGTQIFNTTYATTDPNEPPHCNVPATASYWLGYLPPTNGVALLNTVGSRFPTVLAVYTYTAPLTNYAGLTPVTCDTNSGPDGLSSQVRFTADPGLNYLIVVDGATNDARGIVYLNYLLNSVSDTNNGAPVIAAGPQSRSVAVGSIVGFSVLAQGTNPVSYTWYKDRLPLIGQTNASLTLSNVQPADAGGYTAVLTNAFGSSTSAVAVLSVILPPSITVQPLPQQVYAGAQASFSVTASGTAPLHFAWNKDGVPVTNVDSAALVLSPVAVTNWGNYGVLVFNAAGTVQSQAAPLSVVAQPIAGVSSTSGVLTVQFSAAGPAGFVVESTQALTPPPPIWAPWVGLLATNNGVISLTSDLHSNNLSFFRVRFP
jgi:hypothetical protein